jgi:hypothetical protein
MPQGNQATAPVINKALQSLTAPKVTADLENVELLMALEAQNLAGAGFDNSVRQAAEAIGAEFLFNIPAPSSMPFQRAALVRLPEGNSQIVLVTLSADGVTMNAQAEKPETAHLFRLGEAWLAVVDQFRKLS